jgi:hypothetical protein
MIQACFLAQLQQGYWLGQVLQEQKASQTGTQKRHLQQTNDFLAAIRSSKWANFNFRVGINKTK